MDSEHKSNTSGQKTKGIVLFERAKEFKEFEDALKKAGYFERADMKAIVIDGTQDFDPNPWKEHNNEVTHLITMWGTPPHIGKILDANPNCKWLNSLSAGVDKLICPTLTSRNLTVTNAKGTYSNGLAEFAMFQMLWFEKDGQKWLDLKKQAKWQQSTVGALTGKTVCIVGFGDIGGTVGQKAKFGFNMKVIGVKRDPASVEERFKGVADEVYGFDKLPEVLPRCDYVISCLPLVNDTKGFFKLSTFKMFKPTAVFLNIGRGQNVVEADLVTALKEKIIAGAYLDVMEVEPLPEDSPLWKIENVYLTPHCADHQADNWDSVLKTVVENLDRFLKGEPLKCLVDMSKGY